MSESFWLIIAILAFCLLWKMSDALLTWTRTQHCRCHCKKNGYTWPGDGV